MFETAFWLGFGVVVGGITALFTLGAAALAFVMLIAALPTKKPKGWRPSARVFQFTRPPPPDDAA